MAIGKPVPVNFSGDHDPVAWQILQRPPHHRLGKSFSIGIRSVIEVDSDLESPAHRGDMLIFRLLPPESGRELPRSVADWRDLQLCAAQPYAYIHIILHR